MESKKIVLLAATAAEEKKAEKISILDMRKVITFADYFLICSGDSTTQLKAIAGEIKEQLNQTGISIRHLEGYREGGWVLLDYGDVIVHVFLEESRQFYNLEGLWNDAGIVKRESK